MKLADFFPALVLATCLVEPPLSGGEPSKKAPQIIVLKLDDVTTRGGRGSLPVSPRWQRVTELSMTAPRGWRMK